MSYVEDNLMPNERVLLNAKVSHTIFITPIFCLIVGLIILGYAIQWNKDANDLSKILTSMYCFAAFVFIIYTLFLVVDAIVTIRTTEFAITNIRLIAKTGFIRRNTIEILLNKVESVSVNQGIHGRILKFGSITITGTGGTRQRFRAIVNPLDVRKKIYQILEYVSKHNDTAVQPSENHTNHRDYL